MSSAGPAGAPPGVRLSNGRFMPSPGFGTWRADPALLHSAVVAALRAGYRHVDCAGLYKNEAVVGAAIAEAIGAGVCSRAELFITSKLAPTAMEPALVRPAVERSIADLRVGYLDLFITHWPYAVDPANAASPPPPAARLGYSPEAYLGVWRALEACVDAGLVRSLGASNSTAAKLAALARAARVPPVVLQLELHPALGQPRLRAWAARARVALTGYCPLGSPGRPDAYRAPGDPDVLRAPAVLAAAAAAGRSPAQAALKWAAQRGVVPLPRSTNAARIAENYEGAAGAWALPDDALAALDAMDATADHRGRIMKGDNFAPPGVDWRDMWDLDFYGTPAADEAADALAAMGAAAAAELERADAAAAGATAGKGEGGGGGGGAAAQPPPATTA